MNIIEKRKEENIPKSLTGYSPKALEEYDSIEMYRWAFRDLWQHDESRMNVIKDRYLTQIEAKEKQIAELRDKISELIWKQTVL